MKKHSVRRKRIAVGLVVAVVLIAGTYKTMQHFRLLGDATPSTYHWRGGASSTVHGECISYGMSAANCWTEAQNWVEGSVPSNGAYIVIDGNSQTSPAIPSGASVTLGSVSIDSPNHFITNYGTISAGAFSGTINNYDNINGGIFGGTITNFGGGYTDSIGTIRGGSFTGTVFNNGTIDATGTSYGPPDFTNATFTDIMGTYQCPSGKTWNTNQCGSPSPRWIGGNTSNGYSASSWDNPANWSPVGVPDQNANVSISGGSNNPVIPYGYFSPMPGIIGLGTVTLNFGASLTNYSGPIVGGTFNVLESMIINRGSISGGNYNGNLLKNDDDGYISGGAFVIEVWNEGTINNIDSSVLTFAERVENKPNGYINYGTFNALVKNDSGSVIGGGTFKGIVDNFGTIDLTDGTPPNLSAATVTNENMGRILCPVDTQWSPTSKSCAATSCTTNSQCLSTQYCDTTVTSTCKTGCRTSSDCSAGSVCTNHVCGNASSSSTSSSSSTNSSSSSSISSSSSSTAGNTGGGGGGGGGGGIGKTGGTNVTTLGTPGKSAVKGEVLNLATSQSSSSKKGASSSSAATHSAAPAKVATLPFHPSAATSDVSAGAWYAQAAAQAVAKGWMKAPNGTFSPEGTVTADDMAAALTALHINISTLQTLPRNGASVLSKGEFLQIMSEAFQSKLKAILKTKSQAEYSKAWNAISDAVSHHNAVRMSILAGWISMPQGSFHGAAPITRAEMAKILSVVVGK